VPSVGLAFPKHHKIFGMVYNIGNGVSGIIFGLLFSYSIAFLLQNLSTQSKLERDFSNDIEPAVERLRIEYYIVTTITFSGAFIILIFGAWEYLLLRSTYLYLVFYIIYNFSILEILQLVPMVSSNTIKILASARKTSTTSIIRKSSTSDSRKSSLTAIVNMMRSKSVSTANECNENNDNENILYYKTVLQQISDPKVHIYIYIYIYI
jgi:hypothetical protein